MICRDWPQRPHKQLTDSYRSVLIDGTFLLIINLLVETQLGGSSNRIWSLGVGNKVLFLTFQ